MVMSWIWTGIVLISILCALVLGNGSALAAATVSGAQAGIQLALSMAGSLCLWTGGGAADGARRNHPDALPASAPPAAPGVSQHRGRTLPSPESLSANICANFLGLGNAATPHGHSRRRSG